VEVGLELTEREAAGAQWTARRVRAVLEERGLAPLHRLGQHFVVDPRLLDRMADAIGGAAPTCLEIGPGLGHLTETLVRHGYRVVAVEIDHGLAAYVREAGFGDQVRVVEGDALTLDLGQLVEPSRTAFCGNLPYYLTSPLLHRTLALPFPVYVVMVQREVAARLSARAGDAARGALSVLAEAVGGATRLFDVPPSAFYPQPDVMSTVLRIERAPGASEGERFAALERLVGRAFRYRRKTMRQALREGFGWPVAVIHDLLTRAEVPEDARPGELEVSAWLRLIEAGLPANHGGESG